MAKRLTIKNHIQEKLLFQQRTLAAMAIVIALVLIIFARLIYLQVSEHNLYSTLSQKNQLSLVPIAPNRGMIYDRGGAIVAKNIPTFSLDIIPDKVKNIDETIEELQSVLPISGDDIDRFHKRLKQRRRFETVTLRTQLSDEEVAQFYVNQHRFPGVLIEAKLMRYYPYGAALVDVLGYVGRINTFELEKLDSSNYVATNYIGKVGIEKFYENTLHGNVGHRQVETDASGRTVRVLQETAPISGQELHLTIDSQLQIAAKAALGQLRGAVVALEPSTGEVLALVSNPTYDPNKFVHGMSLNDYQQLQTSADRPLFNRAIRGQYPLGSIIKPFVALTGLQIGVITPWSQIYDPGWFKLKNSKHRYNDWKKGGHGKVDLKKAITVSCNTYFYELAMKLGIDHIDSTMRNFGFGTFTEIDLGEELPGLIPNPDWKLSTQGARWYAGDTILSGIGQGYMLATPLQLAVATSGLANRGQLFQPYLVAKQISDNGEVQYQTEQPLPYVHYEKKYWDHVTDAMQAVIRSPYGTGFRFGKPKYTVAAKTGTAQLVSNSDKNIPERLKDNSVFIAFAPVDDPKIAIAVVVENSPLAPKVARQVMDNYLLRNNS